MTQRERLLAIGVSALLVAVAAYLAANFWSQAVARRKGQIATLQRKLAEQERLVRQTNDAKAQIAQFESRSLPPQRDLARSQYQAWLLDRVNGVKLAEPKVQFIAPRSERDFYTVLSFQISGKGNLQQIVKLLHEFYSVDLAHRVSRMSIRPSGTSKILDFSMTIEAISMSGAPPGDLALRPSQRLALPKLEDYYTAILNRNIFGTPNRAPRFSPLGSQRGETGRPLEVTARATDPDAADKLTYRLERTDATGARIDPATGRLDWTPRRTGSYEFVVAVTDDGIPAKSDTQRFMVTVSDPAPTPPPPRTLAFDEAKYTYLVGVIDENGKSEVWLNNRPRAKTLKLKVGDEFEIGSVKGVVKSISREEFVFECDGKLRKLARGGVLEQAEVTGP
jgi:hypothetical protein